MTPVPPMKMQTSGMVIIQNPPKQKQKIRDNNFISLDRNNNLKNTVS